MENKNYFENLIKKVLSENVEISEQTFLKGLFSSSKNITRELKGAIDDVIKFSANKGDEIMMLAKNADGTPKKGSAIPVKSSDELIAAIKEGLLTEKEAARLYAGLLKTSRKIPQNTMASMVSDLVSSQRFINTYSKKSFDEIVGILQKKGYSKQAIDEISRQIKTNKLFKSAAAKTTKVAKAGAAPQGVAGPQGVKIVNNNTINNFLQGEKLTASAAEGAAAQKQVINRAKASGDKKVVDVVDKASKRNTKRKPKGDKKLKNKTQKMTLTQRFLYGLVTLAGVTGGYFILRSLFGGNTNLEDQQLNVLPECIQNIMDDDGVTVETTADGVVAVKVVMTGVDEYDKAGGLIFYNNGTVTYADGSRKGKYSCKEVGGESEIIYEPAAEIQEIKLKFDDILKLISEQTNEVTVAQMTQYVDTAVDDLDGWVDNKNLASLKNILTSLNGKTYKGKNAISEFLRFYSLDEGGDNFLSDVQSVGVQSLGVQGIELKDEILKLAQTGVKIQGGDGNKKTGIGGIQIDWDTQEPPVVKPPKPKIEPEPEINKFRDCPNFPIGPGCISSKIVEIQRCYKIEIINGKYSSDFEQLLTKIINEDGLKFKITDGLTEEFYNYLMAKCAGTQQVTQPEVKPPVAELPVIEPPKPPTEPIYDQNRLNELLASQYLVKKRNGTIVKWKGPELEGNDYFILNKYLTDQGYVQKKQREIGDKDDEDVQMKYKWKLKSEE